MAYPHQVEEDFTDFYRIHNPGKLADIPTILLEAHKRGLTEDEIFASLYGKYNVKQMLDRDGALSRLQKAVPGAEPAEVRSAVRRAELNSLAENDALRQLERKIRQRTPPPQPAANPRATDVASSSSPPQAAAAKFPMRVRGLTVTVPRAKIDEIMCDELRDWLVAVLGDDFNSDVKTAPNVVDCLRDGSLLTVLAQKIKNPAIRKDEVKLPRSTQGFFARENVSRFLKEASSLFKLRPEVLFTDADLCDKKSDRAVVNCLLAVASAAYRTGAVTAAPAVVVYDKEIEEQTQLVNDDAVEQAMQEQNERDDALMETDEILVDEAETADDEPPANVVEPPKSQDGSGTPEASSKPPPQVTPPPGYHEPQQQNDPPAPAHSSPLRPLAYKPLATDEVDKQVGSTFNALLKEHKKAHTRIKRLAHQGQYVVYHRITGKRTVVYVRVVQKNLMIRVGGGWDVFSDWLSRHLVDCDNAASK